jgi:hypothetical protein
VCPTIQLHAIQEFWELLPNDEIATGVEDSPTADDSSTQLCVCLSENVVAGVDSTKSMRLLLGVSLRL